MRHRPKQRGFTIIETLLFLAISGFIFTVSINQYTNQQRNVNFSQGVRDAQAVLSSIINESASSYAPDLKNFSCNVTPAGLFFTAGPPIDDNSDCIFLGKAFGAGFNPICTINTPDDCSDTITIPIVGSRTDATIPTAPVLVSDYKQAMPFALSGGVAPPVIPDFSERKKLNNNIGIYRTFIRASDGSSKTQIGAVAFIFSLDNTNRISNTIDLVAIPVAPGGGSDKISAAINNLKSGTDGSDYYKNPADGITFCIKDGNNKVSAISVGAGGGPLDVQVENTTALDSGCN